MKMELLYFDGCPHWRTADARLQQVAAEYGATVQHHRVSAAEHGGMLGFAGSPTILIDGQDPFPGGVPSIELSCRLYETPNGPAGAPTLEQLRAVLRQ